MPIKACNTKLEKIRKKLFFQKFRRYKYSDKAKKLIFSALQTFGHFFVRKFVAPKVLGINVVGICKKRKFENNGMLSQIFFGLRKDLFSMCFE